MKPKGRSKRKAQDPEIFFNRELSWLSFNSRVLEEVEEAATPLAERAKFMAIVTNNLDEFFMVRVASLKNAIAEGDQSPDSAGLSPAQQLAVVKEMAALQLKRLHEISERDILPSLQGIGIRILDFSDLDTSLRAGVVRYFKDEVLPVITPLGIDAARPFPMLPSLSINLAVLLEPDKESEDEPRLGVVPVPAVLPRLVRVPGADSTSTSGSRPWFAPSWPPSSPGQAVRDVAAFRVLRDAELDIDDEGGGDDFLSQVEDEVRGRRRSQVVRLDIDAKATEPLLSQLVSWRSAPSRLVYRIQGLLDLRGSSSTSWTCRSSITFRDPPLKRAQATLLPAESADLFGLLSRRDVLLHHPYDSFETVLDFVKQAAADPQVLAIKQTLYRPASDSEVVKALVAAAEAAKQVTVVVELTARFDEASNIRWARRLEDAGAHVIYGIRGLKTHAKAAWWCAANPAGHPALRAPVHRQLQREDVEALHRPRPALLRRGPGAGSLGLLQRHHRLLRPAVDAEAHHGAHGPAHPHPLHDRPRAPARRGGAARPDPRQDERASWTRTSSAPSTTRRGPGCKVKLNVRGICCLRPGLKGVSENIEVVSIIDRYLEHSRIYHFWNGGDEEHYIASADWMPRYDLGRLRPGSADARRFRGQQPRDGTRLATLREVFALARRAGNPRVRFNVETKLSPLQPGESAGPQAFADELVRLLREESMVERTVVQSFDWRTLARVRAVAPEIATSALTIRSLQDDNLSPDGSGRSPWLAGFDPAGHGGSLPRAVLALGARIWSPWHVNLTPAALREAHALGLEVVTWTVNEPARMEALLDLGVDGLITDYPDRLRDVLSRRGAPLPPATPVEP